LQPILLTFLICDEVDSAAETGNIDILTSGNAMQYAHQLELKVRDYECDMQGVVNNGVYQNYLEHARHEFLQSRGINFAEVTAAGINLVVTRAELDYKHSLVSNDLFVIRSLVRQVSRVRFEFQQDVFRLPDETLMLAARITGTSLNQQGRPFVPEILAQLFSED
jgi:acyl-CoA thioester hydrolase